MMAVGWDRAEALFLGSFGPWCGGCSLVLLSNKLLSAFRHCQGSFFLEVRAISKSYYSLQNNSRHSLPRERKWLRSFIGCNFSQSFQLSLFWWTELLHSINSFIICWSTDYFFNFTAAVKGTCTLEACFLFSTWRLYTWEVNFENLHLKMCTKQVLKMGYIWSHASAWHQLSFRTCDRKCFLSWETVSGKTGDTNG